MPFVVNPEDRAMMERMSEKFQNAGDNHKPTVEVSFKDLYVLLLWARRGIEVCAKEPQKRLL